MPGEIDSNCRRLTGKVCVVAGAASAIGQAVARRLTGEGAVVVSVDRAEHSAAAFPARSLFLNSLGRAPIHAVPESWLR